MPWFASAEPHDLGGAGSIIHMVPRSFHDAPFKPLNPHGAVVVRYLPGTVQLVTQNADSDACGAERGHDLRAKPVPASGSA